MEKKRHIVLYILLGIFCALILIAALVYFAGVVFFQTHLPFHTSFMGYDVSEREPSVIDDIMQNRTDARTLTVIEMDGEEVLNLADAVSYHRTVAEPAEGWIPENSSWRWPMTYFETNDLTRTEEFSYDADRLPEAVAGLAAMDPENYTSPVDARLEWQDDICVIIPEIDGNELYPDRVAEAIRAAIDSDEDEVDLTSADCYKTAGIRSDNKALVREYTKYSSINFQTVEIDMTGEIISLTPDDVLSFFTGEPGSYALNEEAVASFVRELKDAYDTYERQRPFVNRYGNEITVGTRWDTYGFKMDLDATTALLKETLEGHERHAQIAPVWTNEAWAREENGSDIGGTYIEVSIADQYLWAYYDGEMLFSCPVVTGNTGNHDTPRGVFRILYMQRGATLTGADYSSYVDYWMPITWSGVGLHDASWRSSFGGSIYTYNGSHGCINMPSWAAYSLYWSYYAGTPVVIW